MRASLGVLVLVLASALAAGCDSKATASDPQAAAKPAEQKSREYESCGASMHCMDNLRCFDHVCRRTARSAVGDFHAASGVAARQKGDVEAAILSYSQALNQYGAEKLEVPPDIDCAYGGTLAAARGKRENAELAARVLHRCILAAPVGGPLREGALASLATLAEVGLDPLAIGATKLADLYLTKAPQKPSSDKLVVSVAANPPTPSKSYALVSEKIQDAALRPAFVACWETYSAAAKKDALSVTLGIKVAFYRGEYEDEDTGGWSTKVEAPAGSSGPEAAAEACVKAVVEPALKGLKYTDGFNTKATITIK